MALFNMGGKKRTGRRKSKRLKPPRKNATLKQKETYIQKMSKRIQDSERMKKADKVIDQIRNYQFA